MAENAQGIISEIKIYYKRRKARFYFPSAKIGIYLERKNSFELLAHRHEICYNNKQQLNKAHHEISKLSHDFKSHIHTITDLAKHGSTDKLCAYLDELSEDLQSTENVAYTGVESIDTVINRKIAQAKEADIIVNISASYSGRIRNIDLCVLLSNIFDNAIDACKRVTDVKKRFINCSISEVGKMAVIKMENSYDSAITLEKRGDDIVTTKENAGIHGYGLRIVRSLVEKYNGTIETTNNAQTFSVYILLNP